MGRASRNVNSLVIMYADAVTVQMQAAIEETDRRREIQTAYNQEHGITARSIEKAIRRGIEIELRGTKTARGAVGLTAEPQEHDRRELIRILEAEMLEAAERLEFEKAATLRDQIAAIKSMPGSGPVSEPKPTAPARPGRKSRSRRSRRGARS